jgi:NADH-quinone oxidoreductase subunit M
MSSYYLSTLLIFPLLCGAVILLLRLKNRTAITFGTAASICAFLLSLPLFILYDGNVSGFQFVDTIEWIPSFHVQYVVGVDGISLMLVVLTTFLTPVVLISSWKSVRGNVRMYVALMLLLETGLIGVFTALDTLVFYVFWELILIPMYFIIGVWGGSDRIYASIKFFIYTMAGSLLMLIGIIWLGWYASLVSTNGFTTDLRQLYTISNQIPMPLQGWLFAAFAISFLIKVPAFPLHTWLPDAHVQAPTGGSIILAGVLLKMGSYGLIRFNLQMFPLASVEFAGWLSAIGVIGIIYGALVSMVQKDMKKLVAYSSVSHMGFVVLGIFSMTIESLQGSVIQMVNHGLSTGTLFMMVGMIYDRRHTRMIDDFGGLARTLPVFSTFLLIVTLSSIGLPGLNGFIGEFLILAGSFKSAVLPSSLFAVLAATGVVLAAVYMLWMLGRVIFGESRSEDNSHVPDLDHREIGLLCATIVFMIWIGVAPNTFLGKTEVTVRRIVSTLLEVKSGKQVQQTPPMVEDTGSER